MKSFTFPNKLERRFIFQNIIVRITCYDGPQVCDFNAFARDDPSEYFWSGRTRTLYGSHLKVGQRLWGTEPKMRPMLPFIADTVKKLPHPHNATSHDLLYSRCSERRVELRTGKRHQPNCPHRMHIERSENQAAFRTAMDYRPIAFAALAAISGEVSE